MPNHDPTSAWAKEWQRAMERGDHAAAQAIEATLPPSCQELLSVLHIPGILEADPSPEAIEEMNRRKGHALVLMGVELREYRHGREAQARA